MDRAFEKEMSEGYALDQVGVVVGSPRRSTGTLIREGVRFARSRLGQQILKSVFGTLFGKKR